MVRLLIFASVLSCATVPAALAEQYWIAYEGNDFPENEGWTREYGDEHGPDHGGAVRCIEDGCLVTDSMYNPLVYDYSAMYRPISPDPGELFVVRWRLNVEQVTQYGDPAVAVFSDDGWGVAFTFWPTHVESAYEDATVSPLTLGEFHRFDLRSWDMRSYELRMDDQLVWSGVFRYIYTSEEVAWGDSTQGASSVVRWDYFRFGVVPEPPTALMLVGLTVAALARRQAWKERGFHMRTTASALLFVLA